MTQLSEDQKKRVFLSELNRLREREYISSAEFQQIRDAHERYCHSTTVASESERSVKENKEQEASAKPKITAKPTKPPKEKKVKTKEQIRERNITWSLILGVVLLLICGLVVATSQWNQMGPGLKVFAISFVSLFFFALSYISEKFLKIKQTAFAFLTLGSLLVPIVIVAIGYFELLGNYLSMDGEGRFLLGLIGVLLPLPLYVRNAYRHHSRLFVWISFLFLSLSAGFGLGAMKVHADAFYFWLMIFNGALLLLYFRYRSSKRLALFMKEVPLYAQLNLIISTLLLLFVYDDELFYSFNLILTSVLYMAMVFVYKTKEYQFVFSGLFAYGIYQLVEHSSLQDIDLLIYSAAAMVYMGFAFAAKNHTFIQKTFQYTSAFISMCAFIYVSWQGILIRQQEESLLLLFAYLVITLNYFVLSHLAKQLIFQYLTPVFLIISMWQLWVVTGLSTIEWFLFTSAAILFLVAVLWGTNKWLMPFRLSSMVTAITVIIVCMLNNHQHLDYAENGFMLFIISGLAYAGYKKCRSFEGVTSAQWIQPLSLLLASMCLYPWFFEFFEVYKEELGLSIHLAITGLVLLFIHLGWKKIKETRLSLSSFYLGQCAYILSLLQLIIDPYIDPMLMKPLVLFIGVGVLFWLVQYSRISGLWSLVALVSLAFYSSLLMPLSILSFQGTTYYMMVAPVFLLTIRELGRRIWPQLEIYFFWLAQVISTLMVGIVYLTQLWNEAVHPLILLVPIALYIWGSVIKRTEWQRKLLLYAGMTVVFFLLWFLKSHYNLLLSVSNAYVWLAASALFSLGWLWLPKEWKVRVEWYLIPFSTIGLAEVVSHQENLTSLEVIPITSYLLLILFFLHYKKWSLVPFVPLCIYAAMWLRLSGEMGRPLLIGLLVLTFASLLAAGRWLYHRLIHWKEKKFNADVYSWSALLYPFQTAAVLHFDDSIWLKIVPVLLAAVWFLVNAKRWGLVLMDRVFQTLSILSFYISYLMVILDYEPFIPDILEAELQVLPLLGVMALLRRKTWSAYKSLLNHIQLALLLGVAGYLVADAIQSHTIWDAWIIGGLSLVSMVAGMQLRMKSYFFVGMGVLIFNVMYQTRPYWGNLPWWSYLLIAGFILIGAASYNEWQKQREGDNKYVEQKLKKLWAILKSWD
ncbi:hypothetical protein Q7A53_13165 [Halobacillus rhizosphaerae]|uniref:hypothetical protein n=1 Tax=Halobacillus rhizosphaerae TaxID=3064889 RepID=UPI00398B6CFB